MLWKRLLFLLIGFGFFFKWFYLSVTVYETLGTPWASLLKTLESAGWWGHMGATMTTFPWKSLTLLHITFRHFGYQHTRVRSRAHTHTHTHTHTFPSRNSPGSATENIKLLAPLWRLPKGDSVHANETQNTACGRSPTCAFPVSGDLIHLCPISSSQTNNWYCYFSYVGSTLQVSKFSPHTLSH